MFREKAMPGMVRIELAHGYGCAFIPSDWILINILEAASSKYVYVFEGSGGICYAYFSKISYFDIPARESEFARAKELSDSTLVPKMVYALPVKGGLLPHVCGDFPYGAYIKRPIGYSFNEDNKYMK